MQDHENDDNTLNNSLFVGGKIRFVRLASNHHAALSGRNVCRPRTKNSPSLIGKGSFFSGLGHCCFGECGHSAER